VATVDVPQSAKRNSALVRGLVHLLLIATSIVSLAVEPVLTLHVILGLAFVVFVGVHLAQRRRTSVNLLHRLGRLGSIHQRPGRLAVSDAVLLLLTAAMLISGLWDWIGGHPTRIRWHAITGVALAVYLALHTIRRRSRLRRSRIR
jgi:hypothetical protein